MRRRTGYAVLSNKLWRDPKAVNLRERHPAAFGDWILMITYANDQGTDGRLSETDIRRLGVTRRTLDILRELGFIDSSEAHGISIHGYLNWNTPHDVVEARRSKRREHMREVRGGDCDMSRDMSRDQHVRGHVSDNRRYRYKDTFSFNSLSAHADRDAKEKDDDDGPTAEFGIDSWRPTEAEKERIYHRHHLKHEDGDATLTGMRIWWGDNRPGERHTEAEWLRYMRGWFDHPQSIQHAHRHTWACEHTLRVLGMSREEAANHLQLAYRVKNSLNQGMGEEECRRRLLALCGASAAALNEEGRRP